MQQRLAERYCDYHYYLSCGGTRTECHSWCWKYYGSMANEFPAIRARKRYARVCVSFWMNTKWYYSDSAKARSMIFQSLIYRSSLVLDNFFRSSMQRTEKEKYEKRNVFTFVSKLGVCWRHCRLVCNLS